MTQAIGGRAAQNHDIVACTAKRLLEDGPAQGEALAVFKQSQSALKWTFVSPAAELFPGESMGPYRVGADKFFTDQQGKSRISDSDYAKAMIDEVENASHLNQRISVAY